MYFKITLEDNITPQIKRWLQDNPRFIRSVLKSTGYMVQKQLKKDIRGDFPGQNWKERWPLAERQKLVKTAPEEWYGKLRNALGYAYNASNNSVSVGWTSRTAAYEGNRQEFGYTKLVTPGMRRDFHRKGIHLRPTTETLTTPARPFVEESYMSIAPAIPGYVRQRVQEYMENGGFDKKKGKGRKYTVYKNLNAAAD